MYGDFICFFGALFLMGLFVGGAWIYHFIVELFKPKTQRLKERLEELDEDKKFHQEVIDSINKEIEEIKNEQNFPLS